MEIPIPQNWKDFWEVWDIRIFILVSLFLQIFLITVSPLRKRMSTNWVVTPLWTAYLLADWAANFSVGLISTSQSNNFSDTKKKKNSNSPDILAFWAPFLLVHLGGPDAITAFALEDNELWLRHLLGLLFQSFAAVYVFFQSLPKNQLWIPTLLMFISGIIKYAERTRALYLASLDSFRDSMLKDPDPGPNYAKLMDEHYSMKAAHLPTDIKMFDEPTGSKSVNRVKEGALEKQEVMLYAYEFFQTFKGLIVDLIFTYHQRNQCRNFFLKRNAEDAFRVVEVELNFIYDVLFTKVMVVYTRVGYIFRFVSFALVITSLGLFYHEDKRSFKSQDVAISYTLLVGAIALDVIAFLKLILSDWFRKEFKKLPLVNLESLQKPKDSSSELLGFCFIGKIIRVLRRRWSESVSCFNLVYYCRHSRPKLKEDALKYLGLTNYLDELEYVESKPFPKELKDHIFHELKQKSEMADDLETAKEISAAKGDWALRAAEGSNKLLPYVLSVDYDQSLLLWHIATELCYSHEVSEGKPSGENKYREFSKLLSDYMIYLMVMQPTMMSTVAGIGQIRFRDTCAEAKKFFEGLQSEKELKGWRYVLLSVKNYIAGFMMLLLSPVMAIVASVYIALFQPLLSVVVQPSWKKFFEGLESEEELKGWRNVLLSVKKYIARYWTREKGKDTGDHIDKCEKILAVNTDVKPVRIKGDKSKSVLFDGCILAKELQRLEGNKWEIMSKVWVEMLSYAAIHVRANTHAQQLSKGGQLITIVWFLMTQLGLGDQFQISEGHARAKLTVGK